MALGLMRNRRCRVPVDVLTYPCLDPCARLMVGSWQVQIRASGPSSGPPAWGQSLQHPPEQSALRRERDRGGHSCEVGWRAWGNALRVDGARRGRASSLTCSHGLPQGPPAAERGLLLPVRDLFPRQEQPSEAGMHLEEVLAILGVSRPVDASLRPLPLSATTFSPPASWISVSNLPLLSLIRTQSLV